MSELCKRKGIEIIEAEACPDHIHMFVRIPPKYSVSDIVGYLKGKSSLMIFERHDKENEDILTHIRNNIAHSREAGIDIFMKTSEMTSEREVSFLLRLINDILSGNVEVKK